MSLPFHHLPFVWVEWGFVLLGLCVGSFLNVVIARLPGMLMQSWAMTNDATSQVPLSLCTPRSHCPHCQTPLAAWYNIPLLSFVWLRGRCAHCKKNISWQYPVVECFTGIWFGLCAWIWLRSGLNDSGLIALAWSVCGAFLLALAWIDAQTQLLPDELTLPLLWLGLLIHAAGLGGGLPLEAAVWGAAMGYGVLWIVYWIFRLITHREGLGYGDFKLLAALGAWLGWPALPTVVLIAALLGLAYGTLMRMRRTLKHDGSFPFGPALVLSAFVHMLCGTHCISRALFFWMF